MIRLTRGLRHGALALLLGALVPQFAAAEKSAAAADRASIERLENGLMDAFRHKDVAAIMRAYAPGDELFVFDVAPPRQVVGWEAYKKDWEDLFAAFPGPAQGSITDLAVTVVGAVAYGHSIQRTELTQKDNSKFEIVVRVTDVYRKVHGQWFIVHEHVSIPVDMGSGKGDLLSKP